MAEGFTIRRGLANPQREAAARIYWEAFGGKLSTVMGPEPRAHTFLMRVMRSDHCFSAYDADGQLIGIAGFKSPLGGFANGGISDIRLVYGRVGAAWRGLVLRMLASDVDNDRFLIDGIAVTARARGLGVGTALLQALYAEAKLRGYEAIRLEVIDGNWRAKALYRREGFVDIHTDRLGPLRLLFGFSSATTMVRPIDRI